MTALEAHIRFWLTLRGEMSTRSLWHLVQSSWRAHQRRWLRWLPGPSLASIEARVTALVEQGVVEERFGPGGPARGYQRARLVKWVAKPAQKDWPPVPAAPPPPPLPSPRP